MQRLLSKSYEINLLIQKRFLFIPYTKKILLKFGEARFIETIEFIETIKGDWTNIVVWLLRFVNNHSIKKPTKKDKQYIMMYADKILPKIKDTFFEGCFSGKESKEESPMSSYITILSEKLNIDPLELMNKYTMRQIEFLTEGLVWNANAGSKEGERKNRLRLVQQKAKNRPQEEDVKIKMILDSLKK